MSKRKISWWRSHREFRAAPQTRTISLAFSPQSARPHYLHAARIRRSAFPPFSGPLSARRSESLRWRHLLHPRTGLARWADHGSLYSSRRCRPSDHRRDVQHEGAHWRIHSHPHSQTGRRPRRSLCKVSDRRSEAVRRSRIPHALRFATHRHRWFVSGRLGLPLSGTPAFAHFWENRRALAVRLVEPARHPPFCSGRDRGAPPAHLAGHWHSRRPAHRAGRREIPRRAPRKRLEPGPRLALRARRRRRAQRSGLGAARRTVSSIPVSRARGRCIIRARFIWLPGSVACRRTGLSPFFVSVPTKRARSSSAPARPWAAVSFSCPSKNFATQRGHSNVSTKSSPCPKISRS